jgi:hypothetical protein
VPMAVKACEVHLPTPDLSLRGLIGAPRSKR